MKQYTKPLAIIFAGTLSAAGYLILKTALKKRLSYELIDQAFKLCPSLCKITINKEIDLVESGYKFQVKVLQPSKIEKPIVRDTSIPRKNPFVRPFDEGIFIMQLDDENNLLLNKFPVIQNHVLVCTIQYLEQNTLNSSGLLFSTYNVIKILNGYAFFNSSPIAGSSQPHKHLQVLPQESYQKSDILKAIRDFQIKSMNPSILQNRHKLYILQNVMHSIRYFNLNHQNLKEHIAETYNNLLNDISGDQFHKSQIQNTDYNLIFTETFMLIIRRRREFFKDKVPINALGFTGSILVREEQLSQIDGVSYVSILEEISEPEVNFNAIWI